MSGDGNIPVGSHLSHKHTHRNGQTNAEFWTPMSWSHGVVNTTAVRTEQKDDKTQVTSVFSFLMVKV